MKRHLLEFLVNEDGPTAVEYAVMLAMIVIACMSSIGLMATETGNSFNNSASQINSVLGS